jgi:hypothetical protein
LAQRHAVTRKRGLGAISIGLALALDLAVGSSSSGLRARDIEIVGEPHPTRSDAIELGRSFGTTTCAARTTDTTMLTLLSDAERIVVHQFDARRWRDLDAVKIYVMRLLGARPEGGRPSPGVYRAEMRQTEILASVEFPSGVRRPLHLANGYAHAQDSAGCEWWGRYLGPDETRWVVWP